MCLCRVKYASSWRNVTNKKKTVWELCDMWDIWAQINKTDRQWSNNGTWPWLHTPPAHTSHSFLYLSQTLAISTAVISPWQTFRMKFVSTHTPTFPPRETSSPSLPSSVSPSLSSFSPSVSSLWPPWVAVVAACSGAPSSRGPEFGVWLWQWVVAF